MEISTNSWLFFNEQKIDRLIRECEIYDAKGSYGGAINLKEIIRLLFGSKVEIRKLTKKIEILEEEAYGLKRIKS